jgi:hypothetical protein
VSTFRVPVAAGRAESFEDDPVAQPPSLASERAAEPAVEFDPDDMFGVRRAWALVPEGQWEAFLARWIDLTENCGYDVPSIEVMAVAEADRWRRTDPAVSQAWLTISLAMKQYLVWRVTRRRS